ncbi:glucosidase 2 subunit beta isoform X1 [Dendroctonus ponderosae]|uniref:Glucosidase II beta subunit N-terminal domain-containing protein n=1 Tax=Dendroctonus ponderosae TaxID=77166 RepID=U4UPU7_DENPD|nr:glucosidase 2 subunit beta isoform X1 [Dendroctonus ponderosae]ERL92050.1 hypothetical protein D910_09372 [Dendroctonus ponderosae]KAH1012378.1 hypothetical protein HUJ05_011548 [Dendroctonus ponderosae]
MLVFKYDKQVFLFTIRRRRLCVATLIVCGIFISYQFLIHYFLSNQKPKSRPEPELARIRGSHVQEGLFYAPVNGKFTCIKSGEVISFQQVNDNYCDCADSSDEPGTNACPDGLFHCGIISANPKYPKMVPSSKVNDGICDCCDGSEEYEVQHLLGQLHQSNDLFAVCPNKC